MNTNQKKGKFYTRWGILYKDFLPSLVLSSHTVTANLEKHSPSFCLSLHTESHHCTKQVWNLVKFTLKLTLVNTLHKEMWQSNWTAGPPYLYRAFSICSRVLPGCHIVHTCWTPMATQTHNKTYHSCFI